jgi:sugar phosphate isomerase/epimerase
MQKNKRDIHLGGTARSPEDVQALHSLGLRFAELAIPDRISQGPDIYVEMKERLGMYYLCHGPLEGDPNDPKGLKEGYLPKVLASFPLMKKLQASVLTIHLWLDSRFVKKEILSFKLDILREVLDRAGQAGVVICLENLSESASHLQAVLEQLPDLKLKLDLGHAQLLTEVNRSDAILERYPDRIQHVHLHDNRGGYSHRDDLHLPLGQGIIDFAGAFSKLREIGYDRTITLELKPNEIKQSLPQVRRLLALDA